MFFWHAAFKVPQLGEVCVCVCAGRSVRNSLKERWHERRSHVHRSARKRFLRIRKEHGQKIGRPDFFHLEVWELPCWTRLTGCLMCAAATKRLQAFGETCTNLLMIHAHLTLWYKSLCFIIICILFAWSYLWYGTLFRDALSSYFRAQWCIWAVTNSFLQKWFPFA